jgi:hypothetical protein
MRMTSLEDGESHRRRKSRKWGHCLWIPASTSRRRPQFTWATVSSHHFYYRWVNLYHKRLPCVNCLDSKDDELITRLFLRKFYKRTWYFSWNKRFEKLRNVFFLGIRSRTDS